MTKRNQTPIALTIAGSDSGGGAGIQADLKTFAALGVHGTTAIASLTAQNPAGVLGVHAVPPPFVRQQLEAVFAKLPPAACKTGMLYSAPVIRTVADWFASKGRPPLVLDPVMVATSGARLLQRSAEKALLNDLLPLAAIATPNLPEAELLAGMRLRSEEDLRAAARVIHQRFGCAALVKGGHLRGARQAVDIYYDGAMELLLEAPFVLGLTLHGTGCTYSAAITGYLALGRSLPEAVIAAKEYITQAIVQSTRAGRHSLLNSLWVQAKGAAHRTAPSRKA